MDLSDIPVLVELRETPALVETKVQMARKVKLVTKDTREMLVKRDPRVLVASRVSAVPMVLKVLKDGMDQSVNLVQMDRWERRVTLVNLVFLGTLVRAV